MNIELGTLSPMVLRLERVMEALGHGTVQQCGHLVSPDQPIYSSGEELTVTFRCRRCHLSWIEAQPEWRGVCEWHPRRPPPEAVEIRAVQDLVPALGEDDDLTWHSVEITDAARLCRVCAAYWDLTRSMPDQERVVEALALEPIVLCNHLAFELERSAYSCSSHPEEGLMCIRCLPGHMTDTHVAAAGGCKECGNPLYVPGPFPLGHFRRKFLVRDGSLPGRGWFNGFVHVVGAGPRLCERHLSHH